MKYTATAMASAGMIAMANAHGFITKPSARMPGTAMTKACGQQVYYNQMGDNYGNVQGELQVASTQDDYNEAACNIWMCKGYKYADNTANVHKFTVGEEIPITVDIRAPHTGTANVSIVSTHNNKMISSMLKHWDVYASVSTTIPEDNKQFTITMPDVGGQCSQAGACVIQWYWNAASVDQTYESCIDFTVAGSGSGSAASAATSAKPATTSAAVKTNVATTPSSTKQQVASTCACTNEKRDALAQDSYCQASTSTVTSVSTSAVTETVTVSKEVTVTATFTVTPSAAATSSASAVNAAVTSSSSCTTSITLTRPSGSIVAPVATGTGMPFPYPGATNTTAAPTAPSVSLAPVYSSAFANVTSAIGTGALTSIVPSASVNAVLSSYMANITSVLPTGVAPTGTAPTALPSGYASATAAPVAGSAPPAGYGSAEAPADGMSLKQILEWIAYLIKGVFQDGEEAGAKTTPVETGAPAAYSKRSHPRAF